LAFDRREPVLPDVVRAKRVELIDSEGRIRGAFELVGTEKGKVVPHLIMRNDRGDDSIEMGVNSRGDGSWGLTAITGEEGRSFLAIGIPQMMALSRQAETLKTLQGLGDFR
jgi:hypothetical protein